MLRLLFLFIIIVAIAVLFWIFLSPFFKKIGEGAVDIHNQVKDNLGDEDDEEKDKLDDVPIPRHQERVREYQPQTRPRTVRPSAPPARSTKNRGRSERSSYVDTSYVSPTYYSDDDSSRHSSYDSSSNSSSNDSSSSSDGGGSSSSD